METNLPSLTDWNRFWAFFQRCLRVFYQVTANINSFDPFMSTALTLIIFHKITLFKVNILHIRVLRKIQTHFQTKIAGMVWIQTGLSQFWPEWEPWVFFFPYQRTKYLCLEKCIHSIKYYMNLPNYQRKPHVYDY